MKKSAIFLFLIFSLLIFNCAKQTAEDHFRKGFRYQLVESYDSAMVEYQKAIKLDSTYVQAYLNLGVVYTEKGMYDQAIEAYQKILRYIPYHTKAYYNLGYVYTLKGDKEKALEQYNQLKSLDPQLAQRLKENIK
jgi:tetratricopeptide (TPR) repeat protein